MSTVVIQFQDFVNLNFMETGLKTSMAMGKTTI